MPAHRPQENIFAAICVTVGVVLKILRLHLSYRLPYLEQQKTEDIAIIQY